LEKYDRGLLFLPHPVYPAIGLMVIQYAGLPRKMQLCHFFYMLLPESPAAEFLPIFTSTMLHTKVNYKAAVIQYEAK